MVISSER